MNSTKISRNIVLWCVAVLAGMVTFGCSRDERRLSPFGWTATDAPFDSATVRLERLFYEMAPTDSIAPAVDTLRQLAQADVGNRVKEARALYWHGRMRLRDGDIDGALDEFNRAVEMTDSSRFPYDVNRYRWNMELEDPWTVDDFLRIRDRAAFFESVPDLYMAAADNMTLGSFMNDLSDPGAALAYFDKADSMLSMLGYRSMIVKNNINRANAYANAGDTAQTIRVLREVVANPVTACDQLALNAAQWNLYQYSGDTAVLREAYARVAADTLYRVDKSLMASRLAYEYAVDGQSDSAMHYAAVAARDMDFGENFENMRWYYYCLGMAQQSAGEAALAAGNFQRALAMQDSIIADRRVADVASRNIREEIAAREFARRLESNRRTIVLLAILTAVSMATAVTVWLLRRKITRHKMAAVVERNKREQYMQTTMALQVAMKETDDLIQKISDSVDRLYREDKISDTVARHLASELKFQPAMDGSREAFLLTFSSLHPQFFKALDTRYPGLSEAERKMCAFIAMNLDTKHIARLLSIKPESVKQARWRLRSRLQLAADDSLEDAVRACLTAEMS